jgi:CheY-like chemotaxis protein
MPKHILIVDDDPDDIELFMEGVRMVDETIQCSHASNGHDALYKLRLNPDFRPDYIFIDLNMPRMNGKQLLAELKKFPELRTIPAIIRFVLSEEWKKKPTHHDL